MKITVDDRTKAAYIDLAVGEVDETISHGDNVNIDLDKDGNPLGIEILNFDHLILEIKEERHTMVRPLVIEEEE